MKLKFLLALLSAMFAATQFVSAELIELNLDDCIDLALKNNRTIEQSAELRENAKWVLKRYRRATGPSLTWTSAVNKIGGKDYETRRANSDSNYKHAFDNTLRFSYPLYSGGKNENNIASAELNLNSADLNLENTKQQVVLDTTSAYYDVLRNKNLITVKENTVNLLQKHLDQVTSKFQIGVVPGSDILSSKVQLANAVQSLVTTQNDYDNALATLSNLIGLPISDDLLIKNTMSYQKIAVNLQDCTDYAFKYRPDGISALYAVKKAEKDIAVVKSNRLPQVNAQVSRTFNGEKVFDNDHNDNWTAGLSISWNVFDNNVTSAQVQENEATLRRLQSVYEQTREKIELDVRKAYNNLIASEKNILTTQTAIKQAEEEYRIAQVKYDEGVGTNLEVMDAQEKFTEAQTNYFTALYNYNVSKAQLDKAMGVPIYIDVVLYDESVQNGKSADLALKNSILGDKN